MNLCLKKKYPFIIISVKWALIVILILSDNHLLLRSCLNIVHPQEPVCVLCIFCIGSCIGIFPMQQLNNYIKLFITINNYMSCPTIKCMSIIIALHISWGSNYKLLENFQQHFQLLPWKHASNYPYCSPTTCMYFY